MADLIDKTAALKIAQGIGYLDHPDSIAYAVSDAITALPADPRVEKLVEALREARSDLAAYIDADWPEPQRAAYPPIQAKWKRDMELCWRIDAALAAWEAGE